MIDGQKQREALAAAERALHFLEQSRPDEAVAAAQRADRLDQVELLAALPAAVSRIAGHQTAGTPVPAEAWEELAAAVGPGPLAVRVAGLRG